MSQPGDTNSFARILIKGAIAAFSGTFLSMLLGAITQIIIVRELGVALYGEYAAITAALGLMAIVLGVGLDTWILHEVSRRPERLATAIWDVLILKLAGSLVLLAFLFLARSTQLINATAFSIGTAGIIFDAFAKTGYSGLRALKRNRAVAILQTLAAILQLSLIWFWLYFAPLNVVLVFSFQTTVNGLTATVLIWYLWRLAYRVVPQGWRVDQVVRGAWMLVTSDTLATIYSQTAIVVLGSTVGTEAVGIFLPALKLITYTFIIPGLLFNVGLPILNTTIRTGQGFTSTVRLMIGMMLAYGLAVIGGFWIWGDSVIQLIFGETYAQAVPLAQAMSFVTLLKSVNIIFAAILVTTERLRARIFIQTLVAIFSIIGSLILIPLYNLQGAVIMVLGVEILLFIGYASSAYMAMRYTKAG